jgi:glutaredoxin 3
MPPLVLYVKFTCPFCIKVLNFIEESSIDIPLVDVTKDNNREQLIELGGKAMVPCLFIEGKPLYESDDIITYLKNNY